MNTGFNLTTTTGPDQTDPRTIDWPARQNRAVIPFEVTGGLPINPLVSASELAALPAGRGDLWHWGEAVCSDAIITTTNQHGTDHVLLIERADGHGWALPGGGLDAGETAEAGCARELGEETGLAIAPARFVMLPGRGVPDPRQGRNAWMVTIPGAVHLGTGLPDVTGLDDAARAAWLPALNLAGLLAALDVRGGELFTAHRDLLRDVLA